MKFILAIILLGLLGFSAISLAGGKLVQEHVETVYSEELYREASHIAQDPLIRSYRTIDNQATVYKDLCTLSAYQNSSIWLISAKGEILLDTSSAFIKEDFPVIKGFNPGQTSGSYYETGFFFHEFQEEHLSVMVPVTLNMRVQGYVAMHLPMTSLYEQRDEFLNILYLLFFLFLLIMMAIIPVFSLMIYRPLRTIIQGADAFASGNLEYNIPLEKEDEMGYLALTLNYMSDELEMTGNYQKKFIANVSHDFRSPLTSIKGYTEAILDGTIPEEEIKRMIAESYDLVTDSPTKRIYEAVKRIPKGHVATYGKIAEMAGEPRMARAVGNALHKNPDPEHIPCFRVVNAKGELAGAFAFGGQNVQAELLRADGVEVINGRVDLEKYGI